MLAHVPSFGRNPRGSPDFLAYPLPKACMHVLGTGVSRCLGVARSASSPKAAQALGCSLTPGFRISFGRVTCMARATSVPGPWSLGFLLLRGACAWVWVVLGLGFRLRPATPSWGVRCGCVCLGSGFGCAPPLLAGVCGVGGCGSAWVSAAPRHSWLGCWAVCVLVCVLRLYSATRGWGVRRGFVCLGSGFGCAPPLLAGVLGCASLCTRSACTPPLLAGVCGVGVCVWGRVSAASRHSWLGCWGPCVFVCALRLYLATPGWGVRRWCVCLGSGFGCAPPFLAGVLGCACARSACTPPLVAGVCGVGVCAWAGVSAAPRHSWLGCPGFVCACVRAPLVPRHSWLGCAPWLCVLGFGVRLRPASPGWGVGVCVFVCSLRLYPATPGWGVRRGCVCLGSGFGCPPPLLVGVLGCVCVRVRTPQVPRHFWLGCAVWLGVLGLRLRLRPATLGWGVGVCVCALRLYPATPDWGVLCGRVFLSSGFGCTPPLLAGVLGCVCVRVHAPLYSTTPGWGVRRRRVCLGSGFGCAPPLLAGVLGCACARSACTPLPWLGCVVWVCVPRLGFRLRLPLLVGVSGCVCACVRAPLVPRHSWLGCAPWVCVLGLGFRLRPASPGWGVGVCVFVCSLRLYPATPGRGVRRLCVCLGSGFGCSPPLLVGVSGCVCVRVRSPLVPRHSWLGWAVWVGVLGLRLGPRTPLLAWVLGCACARIACTPPLLARVCCVGVCAWARFWALPRHSWLGCWGVCVCLRARSSCTPPLLAGVCGVGVCAWARVSAAPRHSWLGCPAVGVLVCALRLYPATPG